MSIHGPNLTHTHRSDEPAELPFIDVSGLSHSETCAGCIVSLTTPTRSSLNASRSVSLRNWAEKASRVFLASYLLPVEAPIYEALDAPPQRSEQCRDQEG